MLQEPFILFHIHFISDVTLHGDYSIASLVASFLASLVSLNLRG